MNLENVKVGDWLKVQVTDIKLKGKFSIKCGPDCCFTINGEYIEDDGQIAFPIEEPDPQGKWMMISNDSVHWSKRKVLMEKNFKFLYWKMAATDEDVEKTMDIAIARYAKEIEETVDYNGNPVQAEHELTLNERELTLDEWAERLKPYLKSKKEKE